MRSLEKSAVAQSRKEDRDATLITKGGVEISPRDLEEKATRSSTAVSSASLGERHVPGEN